MTRLSVWRAVTGRPLLWSMATLGASLLTWTAASADLQAGRLGVRETVADVGVGITLMAAGALSRGGLTQRVLLSAAGAAWLVESAAPWGSPSLALLLAVLLGFPDGPGRARHRWAVISAVAMPVALGLLSQLAAAALLAGVAVVRVPRKGRAGVADAFPSLAAGVLAAVLSGSWVVSRWGASSFDPPTALAIFQGAVMLLAVGHVAATRDLAGRPVRRLEYLLGAQGAEARDRLSGLALALAEVMGDRDLRIHPWDAAEGCFVDAGPDQVAGPRAGMVVADASGPVALVVSRSAELSGAGTVEAVASAVRLTVAGIRSQKELDERLTDARAARTRLVATADRQRRHVSDLLRDKVLPSLDAAREDVAAAVATLPSSAQEAGRVAHRELEAAATEIMSLVAGAGPVVVGGGRIVAAVRELASRTPVPVRVTSGAGFGGEPAAEFALFYVCAESITNAVKHADAGVVDVTLQRGGDRLTVTVRDDGRGGADPARGSGLTGLADRLVALGGSLSVSSAPGAGTAVVATVPTRAAVSADLPP